MGVRRATTSSSEAAKAAAAAFAAMARRLGGAPDRLEDAAASSARESQPAQTCLPQAASASEVASSTCNQGRDQSPLCQQQLGIFSYILLLFFFGASAPKNCKKEKPLSSRPLARPPRRKAALAADLITA